MNDYWEECIAIALEETGINATEDQIKEIAAHVEGGHENYGMAHGHDCIPNPVEYQAESELRAMKAAAEKREKWELSTIPCRTCTTTGWVEDGWGRDVECWDCRGKGRI